MKKLFIAAVFYGATLGCCLGERDKYHRVYNDACHMSDLIRCYQDHLASDSINDYGCFRELSETFLYDEGVADPPVKLENYIWCY